MEEHFVLRVPPDVAARLHALLSAPSSSTTADGPPPDLPLDLAFHGKPSPRPLLLLPASAFRSAARAMRLPPRPRLPAASYTRPCRGTPPQQRHHRLASRCSLALSLVPEHRPRPAGAEASSFPAAAEPNGTLQQDGRSGTFTVGDQELPAYLLDLPCVVESFKTYDDNTLIKTADVGQLDCARGSEATLDQRAAHALIVAPLSLQMIVVQRPEDAPPQGPECRHGLTPPMRDARRRRFRRDPDLDLLAASAHLRCGASADGTVLGAGCAVLVWQLSLCLHLVGRCAVSGECTLSAGPAAG
eukprot:SM004651S16676  [mRNA]  locus=s4651:40:1112:+ [translate_table: standard]